MTGFGRGLRVGRQIERGFTLVELIIAMAVGLVVLAAMYSVFTVQNRHLKIEEQVAEMQQNARAAMDMMAREIRMAGYNPTGEADAGITSASENALSFTLDVNEDGDTDGSNEYITYSLYTADGIQKLGRKSTASDINHPVAEHVESLDFEFYDAAGNPTSDEAEMRSIKISLTLRTARPDPKYTANNGYRTYTLTSVITPRNLSLSGGT